MKSFKFLALIPAFMSFGSAMAATITVDSIASAGDQYTMSSVSAGLQFDAALLSSMSYVGVTFGAVTPASYNSTTALVSTSISSIGYDSSTKALTSLATVGGGAFTMAKATSILGISVGGPGTVSFTNITIDQASKTVFANVTGANGVSSGKYDIFTYGSLTGDTTFNGAGTYSMTATQLALTTTGVNLVTQGLQLGSVGKSVLGAVTNLGSMTGTFKIAPVAAVPEPSTYALMGLGLIGVAFAKRRKSA